MQPTDSTATLEQPPPQAASAPPDDSHDESHDAEDALLTAYRSKALKIAKLKKVPEAERAKFAYRGLRLELKCSELDVLEEIATSAAPLKGWRAQTVEAIALNLRWADLAAEPPEDDEAHRELLADVAERVRVLRLEVGGDVEDATPETFDLLEHVEQRLAQLADAIVAAKMARVSGMGGGTAPLDVRRQAADASMPPAPALPLGPGTGAARDVADGPSTQSGALNGPASGRAEKKDKKEKPKKVRVSGPRLSRSAWQRIAIGAMAYAAALAYAGNEAWKLYQSDPAIVREIDATVVAASLPSARIVDTDEASATARVEVGPEWRSWTRHERQMRALSAVQSLSAKGYRRVDLEESGALVARWTGHTVDLI